MGEAGRCLSFRTVADVMSKATWLVTRLLTVETYLLRSSRSIAIRCALPTEPVSATLSSLPAPRTVSTGRTYAKASLRPRARRCTTHPRVCGGSPLPLSSHCPRTPRQGYLDTTTARSTACKLVVRLAQGGFGMMGPHGRRMCSRRTLTLRRAS